jgi:hypothetical protein
MDIDDDVAVLFARSEGNRTHAPISGSENITLGDFVQLACHRGRRPPSTSAPPSIVGPAVALGMEPW